MALVTINGELYHYGVLGMKWGRRRYQNKDGSLTAAGKKRVSKEYKKYTNKAREEVNKQSTDRYVRAHNKTADTMNNGLIDKYNSDYKKKLGNKAKGHDYLNDSEYNSGYEKLYNKHFVENYNRELLKDISSNTNYKKAKELCDKYSMMSFDELAKESEEEIRKLRRAYG